MSDDPILAAMNAELRRSLDGLRVPGSPRPYHLCYTLRRARSVVLEAAHGSLLRERDRDRGRLSVDIRLGSHEFDNVLDGGLDDEASERESAEWTDAPDDLDPVALRCALWKLTQLKFDEAIEDYWHGRSAGVERPTARMANLIVEVDPAHHRELDALEAQLVEIARTQGRRQAAVIRRVRAGETATDSYDFQVFKGELADIELIDVESGARRRVRDLELIGTPLSALQRIVACGGDPGVDHGYCYAESGSVPVGGVAPAILLSEVELQQASRTGFHEPLLPPPFADDGTGGRTSRLRARGRRRPRRGRRD